jgi:hypothetical protein
VRHLRKRGDLTDTEQQALSTMDGSLLNCKVPIVTNRTQKRVIDEWRRKQTDLLSRNEAIRRLIDIALQGAEQPSGAS